MSDKKTIVEALFEVQRKINEQRMKNSIDNYNAINEQEGPSYWERWLCHLDSQANGHPQQDSI